MKNSVNIFFSALALSIIIAGCSSSNSGNNSEDAVVDTVVQDTATVVIDSADTTNGADLGQ